MTRVMHDSTAASSIPAAVTFAAGYVTGYEQGWPPEQWARFNPGVRICTRNDHNDGDVLDMESGAASPSDAPAWLNLRRAATGVWKSLYYSVSLDPQIQQELAAAGMPSAQVPKWVAWYNGRASLDDVSHVVGVVAKQYANSAITGADYDLSVVADHWPGVDPIPPVSHTAGGTMLAPRNDGSGILDAFIVDNDNSTVATFQILADGTTTAPYVINSSPVSRILGASWQGTATLTVLARGTDGAVYTIRFEGGQWGGYTNVTNGSGGDVYTP